MKIGIDLGGTTMSAGLITDDNVLVDKRSTKTDSKDGADAVIARMNRMTAQLLEENGVPAAQISHIGIGCPGMLDNQTGYVLYSNNIGWDHVNLRQKIRQQFDVPVFMENDANCAAIGEYIAGAGKDYSSMAMVTLGTGIGGAFIDNHRLYRGHNGYASIFGHMVIVSHGRPCNCGREGCWEDYGSVSALIKDADAEADRHSGSALAELRRRDGQLNGNNIFEAVRAGDKTAGEVFDRYVFYIAEGITNLINLLDPEAVIIGGGISREGNFLIDPIRNLVCEKRYCKYAATPVIKASKLSNDAGIIGAACLDKC